jgi:hypothetical protein
MDVSKIGSRTIKGQRTSAKTIAIQAAIRICFGTFSAGLVVYFCGGAVTSLTKPVPSLADEKPVNEPTFESTKSLAKKVCGGPVVRTGHGRTAANVVVVRQTGEVVLMDTDEAFDRIESKTPGDDVWTVAICRSDLG